MSIFEYNKEEEERKLRKTEYEAGEEAMAKLIEELMSSGHIEECRKVINDKEYRKERMKEFHIH